ncbi:hypothetical protein Godav_001851, partial [Gossypium davidsonii]|nr:hypothetical protein [Gossypium davidsonii]
EDGQESGSGYSPLNNPSPNCSSPRPSVLLDDSSYKHWLIVLEFPERPKPLEEEMIDAYVKTLAFVVARFLNNNYSFKFH